MLSKPSREERIAIFREALALLETEEAIDRGSPSEGEAVPKGARPPDPLLPVRLLPEEGTCLEEQSVLLPGGPSPSWTRASRVRELYAALSWAHTSDVPLRKAIGQLWHNRTRPAPSGPSAVVKIRVPVPWISLSIQPNGRSPSLALISRYSPLVRGQPYRVQGLEIRRLPGEGPTENPTKLFGDLRVGGGINLLPFDETPLDPWAGEMPWAKDPPFRDQAVFWAPNEVRLEIFARGTPGVTTRLFAYVLLAPVAEAPVTEFAWARP